MNLERDIEKVILDHFSTKDWLSVADLSNDADGCCLSIAPAFTKSCFNDGYALRDRAVRIADRMANAIQKKYGKAIYHNQLDIQTTEKIYGYKFDITLKAKGCK